MKQMLSGNENRNTVLVKLALQVYVPCIAPIDTK